MPYQIRKKGSKWVVEHKDGTKVAEHDSEEKAKAQMRLLYGVEGGMRVRKKKG